MMPEYDCFCGHTDDEHTRGTFFRRCTVDGCYCDDFDVDSSDEDGGDEA